MRYQNHNDDLAQMHSTHLRNKHIHGLMAGTAIGDALGCARAGLSRRAALKMFGRPPFHYRLMPGRGIYGVDTHLMLMASQSIVQCRSDLGSFRRNYQKRLSWYPFGLPVGIGRTILISSFKSWFFRTGITTGVRSQGNSAATRGMFIALAINGNGHRLKKWVEESTKTTHNDSMAIEGCQLLALLAEIAATNPIDKLDSLNALGRLVQACNRSEFREPLQELETFLVQSRSPSSVARHFGWDRGIRGHIVPTVVMATYCWLRYPSNFNRAVDSAIGLGGDSDSMGAIVGGLVGAHVGFERLPQQYLKALSGYPQGLNWMQEMATRLSHWPHGMHDLSYAPPLPSDPLMQLIRNMWTRTLVLGHLCMRLPVRCSANAKPSRQRRQPARTK